MKLTYVWTHLTMVAIGVQDRSLQCPSNAIWPFKYIPLSKQPFEMQPRIEMETSLKVLNLMLATRTNKRRALSLQESRVRWLILNSSHRTENMHHITRAQIWYEFSISFRYSWTDFLDLDQPFNWKAEIWEPFKMKLIWGLQSWTPDSSSYHLKMMIFPRNLEFGGVQT